MDTAREAEDELRLNARHSLFVEGHGRAHLDSDGRVDEEELHACPYCKSLPALRESHAELLAVAKRAAVLLPLAQITIGDVLREGDAAIAAAGINPWCVNEGRASGHEVLYFDFLAPAIEKAEKL